MKTLLRLPAALLTLLMVVPTFFASCDDDTSGVGIDIMPGSDKISTTQRTYRIKSKTIKSDAVLANTNDSYLGCVIDPETRAKTTCNFLAQFNVIENTILPDQKDMVKEENGQLHLDSCDIRIYISDYYGDSLTTMKIGVHELDIDKIIEENENYYTDLEADRFITEGKGYSTSLSYSVKDLSRPDSLTDGSTYYRSVIVRLPVEYGRKMMEKYYENPDYYKNSYLFIRNVCPGFYFHITGGVGSMIHTQTSTLNLYFKYHTRNEAGRDTIVEGMQRMAATEEVIQQTTIENDIPEEMLSEDNPYTYVKAPAGLLTELEIPVQEITAGTYYNDTINAVKLTLPRYNNSSQNPYNLKSPGTLLLIEKAEAKDFFEKGKLPDETRSFITTYNTSYNAYEFTNIGKLVTYLKHKRDEESGITYLDSESERNAKYEKWEAENPDWNKVLLIPVQTKYSTSTNLYGQTTQTLLSVKNEMGMHSVRLKGGKDSDLQLTVVYSRFQKQ